ncbi:MAG: peptidase M15A [Oscillatoriales cyanobacterium C42_A2020_001]|nr:peptidase M15A [Leptolyngbyaceae cyanobacterium C42_A2020_001]
MQTLTSAQRDTVYLQEAIRAGIHKPLLAALYEVHQQPSLQDGETGLGVAPANRIALEEISTFEGQVRLAANTVRSFTESLITQNWKDADLWHGEQGRYSDAFLQRLAGGFVAAPTDAAAAQLELCDFNELHRVYLRFATADWQEIGKLQSQSFVDDALRSLTRQLLNQYLGLDSQQAGLLEAVRLWQGFDDRNDAIAYLAKELALPLDSALLFFLRQALASYAAYPHQREALLQWVRLWHQFDSRETTIVHLQQRQFPFDAILDTALMTFVQRLPHLFQGNGQHRNALVEGFRHWQQLDSRPAALVALGVNPDLFAGVVLTPAEMAQATNQTDRALIEFIRQIPAIYTGSSLQRESLLYLGQLWYGTTSQPATIQALLGDLKRAETARRDSIDAIPKPVPAPLPDPPTHWTPNTLYPHATILPNGSFTWAEATSGGLYLPPNQAAVDVIVHMAERLQHLRDRIGRPLSILRWYCPVEADTVSTQFPNHHHALGDAVLFYCDGLTGRQLYWFLHPWWDGGLGHHTRYPYLCYVDGRSDRVRWLQR